MLTLPAYVHLFFRGLLNQPLSLPSLYSSSAGDDDRPTASQSLSLSFNDTEKASQFAQQVGEPLSVSRAEVSSRRSLLSSHPSPRDIAYETLASAIRASDSAEDGVIVVQDEGSECSVTLYLLLQCAQLVLALEGPLV